MPFLEACLRASVIFPKILQFMNLLDFLTFTPEKYRFHVAVK